MSRALHDLLLKDRPEQRATLTVLPAAVPAQAAHRQWGWQWLARKQNPLPGSPVFDVLIKAADTGSAFRRQLLNRRYPHQPGYADCR